MVYILYQYIYCKSVFVYRFCKYISIYINIECLAKRKKYGKIIEEPIKISLKALSNNVSTKKLERIIGGNEATFITFK